MKSAAQKTNKKIPRPGFHSGFPEEKLRHKSENKLSQDLGTPNHCLLEPEPLDNVLFPFRINSDSQRGGAGAGERINDHHKTSNS